VQENACFYQRYNYSANSHHKCTERTLGPYYNVCFIPSRSLENVTIAYQMLVMVSTL